jgi:tetrahydromethanopterin S-methyltransferase subunit F
MPDLVPDLDLKAASAQDYDVYFIVPGSPRFVWRNANHSLTVSDSGIAYTADGNAQTAAFSDFAAIHLSTAALGNANNVIDQCKIEFNSGDTITISNAAANGLPNDPQTRIYRDFVRDLHARLVATGHDAINFTAGMSSGRYKGAMAAVVIAGLFFVVTPLVLVFVTGDPHALILMGTGVFFVWPFMRLISHNTPRSYTPDALPDELIS